MAVYVGSKLRGVLGALAAVSGLITLPSAIILAIGALYLRYRDALAVQHALSGMAAASIGLTSSVAWQQGRRTLVSIMPILSAVAVFVLSAIFRAPLWLTFLVLGPVSYLWADHRRGQP